MGSQPDDFLENIWRISNYTDLSGRGGLIASGRWHTRPKSILYCSDEPYTAYCESLRHFGGSPFLIPEHYKLLKIKVPRHVSLEAVERDFLESSWSGVGATGWKICQEIGDRWLVSLRTVILKVPSAARPNSFNFLVNPVHPEFDSFTVEDVLEQPFPAWVRG